MNIIVSYFGHRLSLDDISRYRKVENAKQVYSKTGVLYDSIEVTYKNGGVEIIYGILDDFESLVISALHESKSGKAVYVGLDKNKKNFIKI